MPMPASVPLVIESAPRDRSSTFRALVEEHRRAIYALALDLTGQHHDADDLSQDVFIKAYRAMDQFRGEEGAQRRAWLYRITTTTFLNTKRKKALAYRQLRDDFEGGWMPQESAPATDRRAEVSTVQRHIDQALQQLSPRERTAFVLRHYHDLPIKEVAALMEVADGTVKSLLFRGTRKLRDALHFYRPDLD